MIYEMADKIIDDVLGWFRYATIKNWKKLKVLLKETAREVDQKEKMKRFMYICIYKSNESDTGIFFHFRPFVVNECYLRDLYTQSKLICRCMLVGYQMKLRKCDTNEHCYLKICSILHNFNV